MTEQTFLRAARSIGVERRLAELILDCDRAIREYPADQSRRWLWHIEGQRQRLLEPNLDVIASVAVQMCEARPDLARFIMPALAELTLKRPNLRNHYVRLQRTLRPQKIGAVDKNG